MTQLQIRLLQQQGPKLRSDSGRFDHAKMRYMRYMRYIFYNTCIIAFNEVSHSYTANQHILLSVK